MALIKEYKTDNGIIVNYHRIMMLSKEGANRLTVVMHSYIDKSYRDLEKLDEEKTIKLEETNVRINELNSKEELTDSEIEELRELVDYAGELAHDEKNYHVFDLSVFLKLEDIEDLSFTEIYRALKNVDIFIGAEDD